MEEREERSKNGVKVSDKRVAKEALNREEKGDSPFELIYILK